MVRALVALAGFRRLLALSRAPGWWQQGEVGGVCGTGPGAADGVLTVGVVAAALESCGDIASDFLIEKSTQLFLFF